MDANTVYTLGYSRTTEEDFFNRYGCFMLPDHVVVDVRLTPGTYNAEWCIAGNNLKKAMQNPVWGIAGFKGYEWKQELGNPHGKSGLWWYAIKHRNSVSMNKFSDEVAQWFRNGWSVLILCSEGQPFNAKGIPQCHRIIIAELLRERFPNVPVVHLGAEPTEPPFY